VVAGLSFGVAAFSQNPAAPSTPAVEPEFDAQFRPVRRPLQQQPKRPPVRVQGVPNPIQARRQEIRRRVMQAIRITDYQRTRMQDIRRGHDDELINAGRRLRQARTALDRAIMSPSFDQGAIQRATEELASAQADKIRLDSRIRVEVRNVLTTEQLVRFHVVEREIRQEVLQEEKDKQEQQRQQGETQDRQAPSYGLLGSEAGFEEALDLDSLAGFPVWQDDLDLVELLLVDN
jgi:Spy/CpxP family protein refolding chaperone